MEPQKIGKFIAELRIEDKMTQAELGERIGVSNKTVSRWENGNYMPDISTMQELCKNFDITINELLSGKRLNQIEFREMAEGNLILSVKEIERIKKWRKINAFLEGAGTGILLSAFGIQNSTQRIVIITIGIVMILMGWMQRTKISKHVIGTSKMKSPDISKS